MCSVLWSKKTYFICWSYKYSFILWLLQYRNISRNVDILRCTTSSSFLDFVSLILLLFMFSSFESVVDKLSIISSKSQFLSGLIKVFYFFEYATQLSNFDKFYMNYLILLFNFCSIHIFFCFYIYTIVTIKY